MTQLLGGNNILPSIASQVSRDTRTETILMSVIYLLLNLPQLKHGSLCRPKLLKTVFLILKLCHL